MSVLDAECTCTRVLTKIIFKRAKKHVTTAMTAISGDIFQGDIFSEVSKTGIFLQ
jgi:hypothetical protein